MELITFSVGHGGKNTYKDVATVQGLLNHCLRLIPGIKPLDTDGKVGTKTIDAIKAFQSKVVSMKEPDGRIDPGGKTLRLLNTKALDTKLVSAEPTKKASTGVYKFPLKSRSAQSYKTGMRRYGANRSGGRKHAGCDLYAPIGTPIYAMDDGEVLKNVYAFYLGTYALEIKHTSFIARNGEIHPPQKDSKKAARSPRDN